MFNLPKVKKTLTGLASVKRIKRVVAGIILSTGLVMASAALPTNISAAISDLQNSTSITQASQTGALLLTSPTSGFNRTSWHESHASHESHTSHASHTSSRY